MMRGGQEMLKEIAYVLGPMSPLKYKVTEGTSLESLSVAAKVPESEAKDQEESKQRSDDETDFNPRPTEHSATSPNEKWGRSSF